MRRFTLSLTLLFGLVPPAWAQTLPPPGQWATLPNTNVSAAADPRFYKSGPQSAYNVRDLFANSGGDVATWKGKVGYFLSGGGHAATPDNSLFFVPLDGSGAQRLLGPYYNDSGPGGTYNYKIGGDTLNRFPDGTVNPEIYAPFGVWTDAIRSRHSGQGLVYAEKHGKPIVFMFAGGPYNGPGGGLADPRWVDLTLTFDQQMARPDMGWQRTAPPPFSSGSQVLAWDPIGKQIVVRTKGGTGAYKLDTNTWENWNLSSDATGCCDFQAGVALDAVGRWMYVLGDSVVERYHLDQKRVESLRARPWGGGTSAAFGARNFGGGYASYGIDWHARTRQIVLVLYKSPWVDPTPGTGDSSKTVYLINPATDQVSKMTMGGQVPTDPGIWGMYGRFRVIPGTDAIVSVYLADGNASIGTIPFAQAVPIAPVISQTGLPAPTLRVTRP